MTAYSPGLQASLEKHQKSAAEQAKRRDITDRLFEHMVEISGDPTGSDPRAYLKPEDLRALTKYREIATKLGWPNSSPISLRTYRKNRAVQALHRLPILPNAGFPAWKKQNKTSRSNLVKSIAFPVEGGERPGVVIGHLGLEPSQPVAFARDGLLYSFRGAELQESRGIGWGRLPDPDLLAPAISPGHAMVDLLGRKPLADMLMDRIPGADLARIKP